jgi:hypothetical protein
MEITYPLEIQPSTHLGILPFNATMYYSPSKTIMHTTPTKIKEQQITRYIASYSSAPNPKRCPLLVKPPSFIYAWLLILLKSQVPIEITFTRGFMKNQKQPR